ncbi:MAG: hypothetical protein UU48_C0002G0063 [Candidatus Uhrbacteria bacterium GW2011_GWF2_41_16]|uniref:Carbonic anhydrase n=2 Tax=Candidatus Uhriibacteriota TaxID=1752732 RepID=A0A0G0VC55_9BACT|nr:MAG: hypothetical protein UU31_C0003G0071 [Candidatus Uhrbacteria bacterium GW2011_GWA2_41_10]KKR87548.1 MAG: hypothetical protein UU35_C0002G0049 [Candidatus Uhrbacteria bacterium GW2011_GWC2_41_11]KKR98528.1 MAG: hypothetical protein UU48_C0002G0063 [Candidatus Uhrbacteria bacterium GW2011_GWF2_41_16]HBO99935.1 hypothetical protein [Candidatus Uhrbacteria bacterium]
MSEPEKKELLYVETLRKNGVFLEIDNRFRNLETGMIAVPCADCDQRVDLIRHAESLFEEQNLPTRIHPLGLNGGAILIPEWSPLNINGEDGRVLMRHIRDAAVLKHIGLLVLYGHYPCGAAGLAKLSLEETVNLLMSAEGLVKETMSGMRVDAFFHVDYRNKKRTYFVSHRAWKQYRS